MKKIILLVVLGALTLTVNVNAAQPNQLGASATQEKALGGKLENRGEKLSRLANQLTVRTINLLTNIKQLMTRVENRIAVMEKAGRDVTAAKAKLPAAKAAIVSAEEAIKALTESLTKVGATTVANAPTPKEIRASYQSLLEQVKIKTKAAHQAVVDVIEALKSKTIINQTSNKQQ